MSYPTFTLRGGQPPKSSRFHHRTSLSDFKTTIRRQAIGRGTLSAGANGLARDASSGRRRR